MPTHHPANDEATEDVSEAGTEQARLSVGDPVARKSRLLSRQCDTCIFKPGNTMSLSPGRLRDLVDEARTRGSFIVCHETLPYADPPPGILPAICRGFHDRYHTAALQIIGRLWGYVEVDPPDPGRT
jgi:hypothetical protein